jgi:hypothetical protein
MDGDTEISERERIVKVLCSHFPFSMFFCAMDSIICAMLLAYCAFAYLGFPRGPWSSNIFTDH